MQLLTSNKDLKKTGIYAWTLPAHKVTLATGQTFHTCPSSGACGTFCYAKTGTFQFSNVKAAHLQKLMMVLNDLQGWKQTMSEELNHKRYQGKFIRVHDAGDYFSKEYALAWFEIARKHPDKTFYSYTKEVNLFKNELAGQIPANYIFIYSLGGKQDHLVDKNVDRHSDVFTDYNEMIQSGYVDIEADDKEAAINPNHRIGIFRNNIPHIIKKMNNRKFSDWGKEK